MSVRPLHSVGMVVDGRRDGLHSLRHIHCVLSVVNDQLMLTTVHAQGVS